MPHEHKKYPDPEQECQLVVKGYSGYQREEKNTHPNTGIFTLFQIPPFAPGGLLSSTTPSESVA